MDLENLNRVVRQMQVSMAENKDYLSDLDRAIGDGDHGINMARGFREVVAKLDAKPAKTPAELFKTVGMTLAMKVGGASGPLYGTAFMRAGAAVASKDALTAEDLSTMLTAAIAGIQALGKAQQGEKTMLDALIPAQEALKKALSEGKSDEEAVAALVAGAEEGAQASKQMKATKGRASYLGERSIGHLDPGAVSSSLLFKAIQDCE